MPTFVYSDTDKEDAPKGYRGNTSGDPHKPYLRHLENWFFLRHIYANGSLVDKLQASLELVICERKLKYWESKPAFDHKVVEESLKAMSKNWKLEFAQGQYTDQQLKWFKAKGIKV